MPKFAVEWEITIESVVEAESLEAAEEAARQHTDGALQEWADLNNSEDWRTDVSTLHPATEAAADMGVIKNEDGEWEAVNIMDARRQWQDATIKGYAKVRCPRCDEEGTGQDFFLNVSDWAPGRMQCPKCHHGGVPVAPPGSFIVDPGPAEPLPGDQLLPGLEDVQ
jgi:hypothetical protein